MNIFHALILGIVEGITEFLPISSTGHLILTADLLKLLQDDFVKTFEIVIQLGAILAVIVLYWKRIWNKKMIGLLIAGFIPTAVIGLALYSFIKHYLLGNTVVVLIALFLGGVGLVVFERYYARRVMVETPMKVTDISYKQAAYLGLFQSIALIPGVSRSAATIVGGLWMGLPRKTIVEFSFLLAVPTMIAASGLDLVKSGFNYGPLAYVLLAVGFIAAFITALFVIKALLKFIRNHTFVPFGIYRMIAAVVFALFIL